MLVKRGSLASSAGTGMPDWAMTESRPRVLRDTVLPPVFGPLMMSCLVSGGRMIVSGTGAFERFAFCGNRRAHAKFEERVTGRREGQLLRKDWADAVERNGEAGASEVGLNLGEDRRRRGGSPWHFRQVRESWRRGCGGSRIVLRRGGARVHCSARWSRAVRRRRFGRRRTNRG